MKKNFTSKCPFCSGELSVGRLDCKECKTRIETSLPVPEFFRLPGDLQDFVMVFLACRGNIREVEKELGISYPTVCKKLDLVNEILGNRPSRPLDTASILEQVEKGELSAREATQILKGRKK